MRWFHLRFVSPLVENEYKRIKEVNMKSFFKLLIFIMIISTVLSLVSSIRSGSLSSFLRVAAILIVCIILLRYGYKIERYLDFILAALCLAINLISVINTGDRVSSRTYVTGSTAIACLNSGYLTAIFERLVILELTRLELKVAFSTASLIARLIVWPPASGFAYFYQVFFWCLCLFVDIRRERNDRAMFKSFYDFREEIVKFKNLMVSGLPTNILIVAKEARKKLFINDCFQATFQIDINDDRWNPKEWLNAHHIEKDSVHIESLQEELPLHRDLELDEFLDILTSKSLLANQSQDFAFTTKWISPDNDTTKVFEAKVLPLLWDGKDAIMIIMNDVTQQYMNLTLKIADANKDKMIAMVSHELRNPLNGILGMIYIMEKRIQDSEVLKYLSVCKNSGKLLVHLVNSILDLGQIRNNKLKLVISKGNLAEILQEIYLLFEFQFKQKNLYFRVQTATDAPQFICTDLNRLRQILINLIANALKFTFDGGVTLNVDKDKDHDENILFKVSDTGIGIKDEEKRKLFKMYGRLDQSDQKINAEGVGLGLTISDHLVRLLSSNKEEETIRVNSTFGKGTTLSFSIKANLENNEVVINDKIQNVEEKEVSIGEEGNTDMFRRISTYVLQSQRERVNSRAEVDPSPRRHSTHYEREDKPEYQLTSITDNEDEILIKKMSEKGEVLLVDDNPFNIMVAKSLVEGLGYRVQTALNGKIAVDLIMKAASSLAPFDLVFMDCQMPVMDGFEATIAIRKMIEDGEIPYVCIIALSANDSEDDKKRCLDVGMDDHIAKPVSEARLKIALDKFCKKKSSP